MGAPYRLLLGTILPDSSSSCTCFHNSYNSSNDKGYNLHRVGGTVDCGEHAVATGCTGVVRAVVQSSSPYGAPILFAEKKGGGGLRMCIDYHSLNSNTITDSWPLPWINEMLAQLRGAKYFSKLDLRDGYHQVPVKESDRFKMAFTCLYGTFEDRKSVV